MDLHGKHQQHHRQPEPAREPIITEIELHDLRDFSKAPIVLHVSCALMPYILDLEGHDDEERYMRKEFVYDATLNLRKIRVLNAAGAVCKIIREYSQSLWLAEVSGPVERITNENQPSLDHEMSALLVGPEYYTEKE